MTNQPTLNTFILFELVKEANACNKVTFSTKIKDQKHFLSNFSLFVLLKR